MSSIVLKALELEATSPKLLESCISMQYVKEYYTPYSTLKATFVLNIPIGEIIDVELIVNGTAVHNGIVDTVEIKELSSFRAITVSSRSHTSMLGQNELVPGLISNVSLNTLMSNYIQIPNVFHENNAVVSNYIYVKEHASLWEAVTNLCLKQNNTYPYIANVNTIRYTLPASPKTVVLSRNDRNIIACGNSFDYTNMISDFHMRDTEGTYNTFNKSDSEVSARGIVRHKHISFDRQWLDDPIKGLGYRINYGMRGFRSDFVSYLGYTGEDLNDLVTFENLVNIRISKIEISGSSKGLLTKLTCYRDRYNNM